MPRKVQLLKRQESALAPAAQAGTRAERASGRRGPIRRLVTGTCLLLTLAGCTGLRDLARIDSVVIEDRRRITDEEATASGAYQVDFNSCEIDRLYSVARGVKFVKGTKCEKSPDFTPNADPKLRAGEMKAARDELTMLIIRTSDHNCALHLAQVYANAATLNSVADIIAAGLSGAAAVVSGGVAPGLAAGASVVTGSSAILDKEVYQSQVVTAIIHEIRANRESEKVTIEQNLGKPAGDYPVDFAIDDTIDYNELCSFHVGLSSLLAKAGEAGAPSQTWVEGRRTTLTQTLTANTARIKELTENGGAEANKDEIERIRERNVKIQDQLDFLDALE